MTLNINPSLGEHIDNEGHLPDSDINNLRNLGGRSRTTLTALATALMLTLSQAGEVNAKSFDHSLAQAMQQVGLDPSKSGEIILASSDEFDLDALLEEGEEYAEGIRKDIEESRENIRRIQAEIRRIQAENQRLAEDNQRLAEINSRLDIVINNLTSTQSTLSGGNGLSHSLKEQLKSDLIFLRNLDDPDLLRVISILELVTK